MKKLARPTSQHKKNSWLRAAVRRCASAPPRRRRLLDSLRRSSARSFVRPSARSLARSLARPLDRPPAAAGRAARSRRRFASSPLCGFFFDWLDDKKALVASRRRRRRRLLVVVDGRRLNGRSPQSPLSSSLARSLCTGCLETTTTSERASDGHTTTRSPQPACIVAQPTNIQVVIRVV